MRLRTVDGGAANEIVTPLRTPTGETLLIDRGYVKRSGSGVLPPIAPAPAGPVTLTGYQRVDEPRSDRPTLDQDGYRQVYSINAALVAGATGVTASPGYVQLEAGQPGVLTAVPLPPPDPNTSYSYAWQWLIFGVMAIGAWFYFARLEYLVRAGRRTRDEPRAPARTDPRDRPDGTAWDDARPDEPTHDPTRDRGSDRGEDRADDRTGTRIGTRIGTRTGDGPPITPERTLADRYGRR